MNTFVFSLLGFLCLSAAVRADSSIALPLDLGGVSVAAARRSLEAAVRDWEYERESIRTNRLWSCGLTETMIGTARHFGADLEARKFQDHYLFPGYQMADGIGPSRPIFGAIKELLKNRPFNENESQLVKAILERETPEASDRIRQYIDLETLMIRVSARLYDVAIAKHEAEISPRRHPFWDAAEICAVYTLTDERNEKLGRAARRLMASYDFLEQAIGD